MISIAVSIDLFQIIDKFYSFQRKLILKLAFNFLYPGSCVGDCSECCDEVEVTGLTTNTRVLLFHVAPVLILLL